jgi:hypothetical protein
MSIESELQDLVTQARQLDVTFRDELVDTNTDVSQIRTRVTNIEIQLGLPDDNASSIPGGGGGNSTRPDAGTNLGNDVIEIDIAGELIWLWNPTTNSWVSIPFTAIAPPVAVDVQSVIDQANAAIDTEITAKTDALLESIRATLISTQQTEIDGLAAQVTTLGTTVDGNTAAIQNEATARADANTAMASTASTLAAQVEDNHTAFTNFQAAVVADPNGAAAEYLQGIQASVESNTASLATEISTRATADSAISTQVSSLTTSVSGAVAAVQQEVTARTTAVSAVTSSVTSLASRMGTAEGAITTVQGIVAGLDGSSATQINTLTTNVGNLTTTVQDVSSSVNGIKGKRSLAINANGQVTGIELLGGGTTGSQIKFQAASFIFYDPSTGIENAPFVVSGGVTTIKNASIGIGSIDTLKIAGNAVIVPAAQTRSDIVFSTGAITATSLSTVISQQITLPYACTLVILYQGRQDYYGWNPLSGGGSTPLVENPEYKGALLTETSLLVNNSVVRSATSGSVQDFVSINHSLALPAGTHTVSLLWRGQRFDDAARVNLANRNLTLIGAMR